MRAPVALAVILACACGKGDRARERPAAVDPVAALIGERERLPLAVPYGDYVGAAACAECHPKAYAAWARSPHGRAMGMPSAERVLGDFAGQVVDHSGGQVVPIRDGDRFVMELRSPGGTERHPVDLWLGSGRQQQVYFTRDDAGGYLLLPIFWATVDKRWVSTALYQAGSLTPGQPGYWKNAGLEQLDCWSCQLSQRHRAIGKAPPGFRYVDPSINCEACHGPGAEHVRRRRAGDTARSYRDLKAIGKEQEARLCGSCHGAQQFFQLPPAADGWPEPFIETLAHSSLRPDGTQRLTSYQYTGHRLSRCHLDGALLCSSCHAPHGQAPRSLLGESAAGADSDKQCTVCHRNYLDPAEARSHSAHAPAVRCVDCHMAFSWIGDDPARAQRTSDHSISIPRPAEGIAAGTPDACSGCHQDRDQAWAAAAVVEQGWQRAAQPRPWVLAMAAGRKRAPGATAALLEVALAPATDRYLRASALDLLARQPRDPGLAATLEPLAADPDPQVRQTAIAALIAHADDPQRWRRRGSGDDHPFVRMKTFPLESDPRSYAATTVDRQIEDMLRYLARPMKELVRVAKLRANRGEIDQAVSLIEAVQRLATPAERSQLGIDAAADYLKRRQAAGGKR